VCVVRRRVYSSALLEETVTAKKCAHPSCTCVAESGQEFCSRECGSGPAEGGSSHCACPHSGCKKKEKDSGGSVSNKTRTRSRQVVLDQLGCRQAVVPPREQKARWLLLAGWRSPQGLSRINKWRHLRAQQTQSRTTSRQVLLPQ
jgi:hypothetical protein